MAASSNSSTVSSTKASKVDKTPAIKKDSIDQVNCNKVQKTQLDTNIHVEDMLFLYTNADSLPNKLQELKQLIMHLEILESIVRDRAYYYGQLFIKRLL